ncbi:hypothetical protein IWQ61_007354 [Dispira simplex]|nr:hypothetical protein IWQ61_007354 [Dispira simplex]
MLLSRLFTLRANTPPAGQFPGLLVSGSRLNGRALGGLRHAHAMAPRVVVLGSGWAGFEMLRDLNKSYYDVTVVSPRNYFVFTPLLASTSVGTLEFRCIVEPVRSKTDKVSFYEATCDAVNVVNQTLSCTSQFNDEAKHQFTVPYDILIVAVGAQSNTFGIPGVEEHALFLKDVKDARKIRQRVIACFERASQPYLTAEEQREILHFAVVGGGPTGVEFSGELSDFIHDDLSKIYPTLMDKVTMSVYDIAPTILSTFDSHLANYASKRFQRQGIRIRTNTQITTVTDSHLVVEDRQRIPYGMLVWATGVSPTPLVQALGEVVAKDTRSGRLLTDAHLRLLHPDRSTPFTNIFSLGDCAADKDNPLPATAQVAKQQAIYLSKGKRALKNLSTHRGLPSTSVKGDWRGYFGEDPTSR